MNRLYNESRIETKKIQIAHPLASIPVNSINHLNIDQRTTNLGKNL